MADYTNPEVLVSTDWVQDNIGKPGIKIVESNEDILLYDIEVLKKVFLINCSFDCCNLNGALTKSI